MVELDFPAMVPQEMTVPHKISEILGFRPTSAVFSGDYYLFEAENAQTVSSSAPDFAKLVQLPMPEVIITARSSSQDYEFISRFFAPQLGIDEDPVTGSAHCLLAPYWGRKLSKSKMRAYQASRRGGSLGLDWMGDRVYITGKAKMVFEGVVLVD
jgi:predicted PhzF superfamily epimerase YddE/YHI9